MADHHAVLLDARFVEDTHLLARTVQTPRLRNPAPLIEPGQTYGSVLRDSDGSFRMYYLHGHFTKSKEHPEDSTGYITRLATSADGIHWQQPTLEAVQVKGSRQNNAVMGQQYIDRHGNDLTGGSGPEGFCVLDAEQQHLPQVRDRYTVIYLASPDDRWGGICLAHSPDGLEWTAYPENPVIPGWHDTQTCVYFDPRRGRYVMYLRPPIYAGQHGANRKIARAESDDLVHWSTPQVVLDTDDADSVAYELSHDREQARGSDYQWYGLTAFPLHDLTVGLGWLYHEPSGEMWIELLHSYDGIDWRREPVRVPFIGDGVPQGLSGKMFMTMATPPLVVGDELWLYVTASPTDHHTGSANATRSIMLLALPRDRWVSYGNAGTRDGMLLSRPLDIRRGRLTLNAVIEEGGRIDVAFRDEWGLPLTEWGVEEVNPLTGPSDGLELPVTFYGKYHKSVFAFPTTGEVRLHFTLHKARLYGWTFHE